MLNVFERLAMKSRSVVERVHGKAVMIYPVSKTAGPNDKPSLVPGAEYQTVATFFQNTLLENESKAQPLTGNGRMLNRSPQIQASITLVAGKGLSTSFYIKRIDDGAVFLIGQADPDGLGNVLALMSIAQTLPE
jgi:hypothetical protein